MTNTNKPDSEPVAWMANTTEEQRDNDAVDVFADEMKEKLATARAKGRQGWRNCDQHLLSSMLHEHVRKGDPVDVANFCMFLSMLSFGIESSVQDSGKAEPVAWIYDLDMGNGRKSINWTSAKYGDWDSVLAENIRPLYTHPATPSQADLKRVLEGLECGLSNCEYLEQVSPSWNRMMKDDKEKIRAAITLIEGAIK